jgi:Co/Zn/Cd efflux system component
LLLAALAYTYARKHADDPNFTFGAGKLGDLAGFTSAIVLAMIALLIGYERSRVSSRRCRSISLKRSRSPVSAWR